MAGILSISDGTLHLYTIFGGDKDEKHSISDGNAIPAVGFAGFMILNDGSTYNAVREALRAGYRHIDTAAAYFTEAEVGGAIRDSGISRKDIFVTSKLWLQDYGYEAARAGIEASLRKLHMDYVDLYLLHQPYGDVPGAWKALERDAIRLIAFGLSFSMLTTTLAAASAPAAGIAGKKPLVVYFSMPETDDPDDMTREEDNSTVVIDGKVLGNTQYVAQMIQKLTGADIFRILPQKAYPKDHRTLVDLAEKEQEQKARPAIAGKIENLAAYETIFLGYPNWWGDMPMILYTFLEQNDLSGKSIIPFCTHGGSGFSRTIRTIQAKQPGAFVMRDGDALSRDRMERAPSGVAAWLKEIDLKK